MIIFQGVNKMSDINFTVTERGYEITEVNKYITMIQQEYANAVAWGEEMERKYEELKKSIDDYGLFFTISEENQNEVIANVFAELSKTVAQSKAEADRKSREIIDSANQQAREIKRKAMENSVEIRTQNTTIMNNLKAVNEMITLVVEKGLQY
jgi:cell division septum initiation protein DivIVA